MKLSDFGPDEVTPVETAEDMASKGFGQLGQAVGQSLEDQWQKGGEQIHQAASGSASDPATREALMNMGQQAAMSTVGKTEAPKMVPKGTFKNKFNVDAYHGTKADIQSFDPEALGASTGANSARKAFFFAEDPSTASDYANLSNSRADLRRQVDPNAADAPISGISSLHVEDELKSLQRSTPEVTQSYLDQLKQAKKSLQDELDGKPRPLFKSYDGTMQPMMPRPKDYLQNKLQEYSAKIPDVEQLLTKEGQQARADRMQELQSKLDHAKQEKEQEHTGQNVIPVKLRMENPYTHDFKDSGYRDQSYSDIIDKAKAAGHDSVIFKNTYDPADPNNRVLQNIYAVFEPHQVRSKFAEFNPKKAKSGNLSYAEGGEVGYAAGGFVGSTSPMTLSLSSLNPADVTQVAGSENEMKYGSLPQQALAGAEGFARGVSLGTSDHIENQLAKFNPELFGPEARKGRIAENPATSTLANMGGGAALIYGTGGMAAPIEAGLGGGLAARAVGFGLEGGMFGAGNAISDSAMGDPNLNAQKVLSEIGMGAALGSGLGVLSKGIESVPALLRGSKAAEAITEGTPVIDVPKTGVPSSLEEMERRVSEAKAYGGQPGITELPPRPEAVEAASRVGQNMQFPVTPMQMDSLASQDARNEFKTMLEVPGKNGQILRDYQGAQKKELTHTLDHTIDNIVPGYEPTSDAAVAGERASELFTKQIQGTRDSLGPAFEQIKSTPLNDTDHLPGVMEYLTDPKASPYGNPKLANMFDTGGDELAVLPYKTSMGIDRGTYSAVKQAVESLRENPKDFETLFDVRKGLSQNVDVTKLGDTAKEIAGAKAAMMDYIQDAVQSQDPDLAVRDTFKKWAINEQNAQLIERKFGAEIGSGNFRSLARGKSDEGILKKIFSDSETVNAVKNILPVDDFNKLVSDHLSILRNDATDKGVFSSNKFYSQLKRGQYALNEAFQNNAEPLQKIKDSLTLLRIFADDAPINPSGTAKTLIQSLLQGGLDPFAHMKNLGEFAKGKLEEMKMGREINLKLAGQSEQAQKLNALQGMVQKVNHKIEGGARAIFNSGALRGAALSGVGLLSDHAYDKIADKISQYVSNPQALMEHMADNTTTLHHSAPNITQALQTSMVQGVTFLNDKLPKPPMQMPLSSPWKPSAAQKTQFNQYYQAVNNPIGTLQLIKNGSLSNGAMEALQAVHPHLLQDMRAKVHEHMSIPKAKVLNYSQKIALAKFLGQPLDENMLPAAIQANQLAMQSPNQSQQTSQAQARKGRSSLGGLKQLDFAGRAATRTSHRDDD